MKTIAISPGQDIVIEHKGRAVATIVIKQGSGLYKNDFEIVTTPNKKFTDDIVIKNGSRYYFTLKRPR
jgi:hypothetical protein